MYIRRWPDSKVVDNIILSLLTKGGDDYQAATMEFTFTPDNQGESQSVPVIISDDNDLEGNEVFLGLLNGSAPRLTVAPDETVITIIDNDSKCYETGCDNSTVGESLQI